MACGQPHRHPCSISAACTRGLDVEPPSDCHDIGLPRHALCVGRRESYGFGCSDLAQYALAENEVHIGGTTWEQYRAVRHVPRSRLMPGDLVFFYTYGSGASHVGIYIGVDPRQSLR
ncbi:MAG: hypothetical protein C7B45_08640 [Sulfobacillus acidophilus]|uniref:NlpC/P60 domain-containing protein n=1 Tax=Sulfobacillus acidophilus TaxID=53633 RepID=A0A2T2WI87_9FIRM|nr:MAG: hypothetical protein C7B45_08640 [Sulfobacillus acidophilus]